MSVIIIPSSPKTRTHEFTGVSSDGREMAVKVMAAADIAESAVMGILLFLWILLGFGAAFTCLLLDGAGFIDMSDRYPEYVPLVGGFRIGRGLFRVWVAAIPLVSVVFPFVLWLFARKDLEAMQVGR